MCIFACAGLSYVTITNATESSKCYTVKNETYCYYTNGLELLTWNKAKAFCEKRNSTLPIITYKDVDNVFQQFIVSDWYSLVQNRPVWIAAHARPVNNSVSWHWIDGRKSGTTTGTMLA